MLLDCLCNRKMSTELNKLYYLKDQDRRKPLGEGVDSKVYRVYDRVDGESYAMKVLNAEVNIIPDGDLYTPNFLTEARILIDLANAPHIMHVERVFHESPLDFGGLKMRDAHVLITTIPDEPYVTLDQIQFKNTTQVRYVFVQIARALAAIDRVNVSHMDLHLGNVLVNKHDLNVTVIDFGRSQYKNVLPYYYTNTIRAWEYFAPPELKKDGIFGYDQVTVWCFGVLMYYTIARKGVPKMPVQFEKLFSRLLRDLLGKIFVPYEKRIGLRAMLSHPYFNPDAKDSEEMAMPTIVRNN